MLSLLEWVALAGDDGDDDHQHNDGDDGGGGHDDNDDEIQEIVKLKKTCGAGRVARSSRPLSQTMSSSKLRC